MKMNPRWIVATAGTALLAIAFFATQSGAQPNSLKKIAGGVRFREGDMKQGHSNNTIIEMKDYLIVVDANFPSGARLAMADAKKLTPKPVKYVFITHHHGDHDYGSAVWTAEGATTFAYQAVVDELNRYEPARWRDTIKTRPDVAALKRDTPEYPKQTFDKSPYILKDGTREVLAAAAKLNPQFVLPGHGPAGGPEILSGQAAFMTALRKAAADAVGKGKKLSDVVTISNANPTATSLSLPAEVQHWVGPSLPLQVMNAYNEVSQNKPVGDLPHQ